jgi:cytochrome c biogenesis factor
METGDFFIVFACFLLLFDFILLLMAKQEGSKRRDLAFIASAIACVLIVASYFRLTMAFVNDNFWISEVYTYSSSGLSERVPYNHLQNIGRLPHLPPSRHPAEEPF